MSEIKYEIRITNGESTWNENDEKCIGYSFYIFFAKSDEDAISIVEDEDKGFLSKLNVKDLFSSAMLLKWPLIRNHLAFVARWDNGGVRLYDEDWLSGNC